MQEGVPLRLVARFPPGEGGGWRRVADALSALGFRVEGTSAKVGDCDIEYVGSSMEGDEVMLRVRVKGEGKDLDKLAEALLPPCWYLDIYYGFRGEDVRRIGERLGLMEAGRSMRKIEGVEVVVEYYPEPGRLTVSYRVGWDRKWGDKLSRIHKFFYSGKKKGVWRWIK